MLFVEWGATVKVGEVSPKDFFQWIWVNSWYVLQLEFLWRWNWGSSRNTRQNTPTSLILKLWYSSAIWRNSWVHYSFNHLSNTSSNCDPISSYITWYDSIGNKSRVPSSPWQLAMLTVDLWFSTFCTGVPFLALRFDTRPMFRQEQNLPFSITFNNIIWSIHYNIITIWSNR